MEPQEIVELNAEEATSEITALESLEALKAVEEAEAGGKGRKTVLEAVTERREAFLENGDAWLTRERFGDLYEDGPKEQYFCGREGCPFSTFDEELIREHVRAPHP